MDAADPFKLVFEALDDYKRRFRTTDGATIVVHPLTYRAILSDTRYFQYCGDHDTLVGLPLHVCAEVGDDQAVVVAPPDPQAMTDAVEGVICFWGFLSHPAHSVGCAAEDLASMYDMSDGQTMLMFGTNIVVDTALVRGLFWVQLSDRRIVTAVRPGCMECVNVVASPPPPKAKPAPEYTPRSERGGEDATDLCDDDEYLRISALVDEQLAHRTTASPEKCKCGDSWHGLPITEKMREMRSKGAIERGYSYITDTSRVLCPGTHAAGTNPPKPIRSLR